MSYQQLYQNPKASFWSSKKGHVILWIGGILVALEIIGRFSSDGGEISVKTGSHATLTISGATYVEVATTESACKEMEDAFSDMDEERLKALLLSGSMYPADNNSEVIVLDRGINRAKVRIVSGNQTGEIGWVPISFLRSQ